MKDASGCIVSVLSIVALVVINIVVNAWALTILWAWFVVPVFALPILTIGQAAGLACIISFIWGGNGRKSEYKTGSVEWWSELVSKAVFNPVLAVAVGFIIHLVIA